MLHGCGSFGCVHGHGYKGSESTMLQIPSIMADGYSQVHLLTCSFSLLPGGCLTAPESLAQHSTGPSPMRRRAIADSPAILWSSTGDAYGHWSRGKAVSCSPWTS